MSSEANSTALPSRICSTCNASYGPGVSFCLQDGTPLSPTAAMALIGPQPDDVRDASLGETMAPPHGSSDPRVSVAETRPVHAGAPILVTDVVYPPKNDPLAEGAQVGEYLVGRKIGDGGMGVIYAGIHPVIGKRVAIKVLHAELASAPDIVQRFILEAKAVNQIGHRNIVDIFSFGRLSDGRHYFVMEFLEGQSLASRIARDIPVPWDEAISMWQQIAAAVGAAHDNSIVHRDLKPDNVYVTPSPEGPFVKVLDFGIAKLLGDTPGLAKTSAGAPIGTPMYMAPEQARGETVDARADIYAFGVILYETISGRPPFVHHHTFISVLAAQMSEPPPPLASFVDVHPQLDAFVSRLLAKEPAERPRDMAEVRAELSRLRDLAVRESTPLFGPRGQLGSLAAAFQASPTQARSAVAGPGANAASATAKGADEPKRGGSRAAIASAAAVVLVLGGVGLVQLRGWASAVSGSDHAGGAVVPATSEPPRSLNAPAPATAPSPAAAIAAASAIAPNTPGRLAITTNAMGTRVYLDKSPTERSAQPAAAGGMSLKLPVPPGVSWTLRVEADGYKPVTMPLTIAAGEETQLPVALTPIAAHHAEPRGDAHGDAKKRPADAPAPSGNEHIINPF